MALPKVTKRDRGYYLRVWRAERNLTADAAAKVFGIDSSHWSLIESGRRNASPKIAAQLADAVGQPIQMFLGIAVPK